MSSGQIAILVALLIPPAFAQGTRLGQSCDLASVGATDTRAFLAFDRELKAALVRHDSSSLLFLVTWPLRINESKRGSYSLNDPAALQSRFEDAFPPAVQAAVRSQQPDHIFCNSNGVMYADGTVWVGYDSGRYSVLAINLPGRAPSPSLPVSEFACNAANQRVLVDSSNGALRYRAWNKPRFITEKPDIEITSGQQRFEGTGACAHPIWTFQAGITTWVVEGSGCSERPPPIGVRGSLEVSKNGQVLSHDACY